MSRIVVSGRYAGPIARLLAYVVDGAVVVLLVSGAYALTDFVAGQLLGLAIDLDRGAGLLGALTLLGAGTTYQAVALAVDGRTVGKALLGLRVVDRTGRPLRGRQALARAVLYPLSFVVVGLGLVGVVVHRERRALHDLLAGTAVIIDWGDRRAELPSPLSRWLSEHEVVVAEPERTSGVE